MSSNWPFTLKIERFAQAQPRPRFDAQGRWVASEDNPCHILTPIDGRTLQPNQIRDKVFANLVHQFGELQSLYGQADLSSIHAQLEEVAALMERLDDSFGAGFFEGLLVGVVPSLQYARRSCPDLQDPFGWDYIEFLNRTAFRYLGLRLNLRSTQAQVHFRERQQKGRYVDLLARMPYDLNLVCVVAPFKGYATDAVINELRRFGESAMPFAELGVFALAHLVGLNPEACQGVCLTAGGDLFVDGENRKMLGFYTQGHSVDVGFYPSHEPDLNASAVIAITA